ncbi:MAG: hypothetical protein EBS55_08040 [Flavobacteriaceae bacterium]|nr:hypothetical protein [Flavobacteriaceae bacterium]
MIALKKVSSSDIKQVVRKITWQSGVTYDMYRHDIKAEDPSKPSNAISLYDANYYVVNSDYRVYICIDNGSSVDNPTGNPSTDEPVFTSLEPSKSGEDGYVWKYLYTISPGDIIKFDSTEYIPVPNDWETSEKSDIKEIRDNGNSDLNNNQLKKIYINNKGSNYVNGGRCKILGDGEGAEAIIEVNDLGEITNATIVTGGKGYTYGIIDLDDYNKSSTSFAELIPIIPPSKGHGYDLYNELGADKILIYIRFDDSSPDYPIDTKFAQIGIIKNPQKYDGTSFTESEFSGLYALKLKEDDLSVEIGEKITQTYVDDDNRTVIAKGYVASYDSSTKVLKYFRDRSLYYSNSFTHIDNNSVGITTYSKVVDFKSTETDSIVGGSWSATIDTSFNEDYVTKDSGIISLGVVFEGGISKPEINKKMGDIIYLDNRPLISRNSRQKEDIKVILEF